MSRLRDQLKETLSGVKNGEDLVVVFDLFKKYCDHLVEKAKHYYSDGWFLYESLIADYAMDYLVPIFKNKKYTGKNALLDGLSQMCQDKKYGKGRESLIKLIGCYGSKDYESVLANLIDDADISIRIIKSLTNRRSLICYEKIKKISENSKRSPLRTCAIKYLKKIDENFMCDNVRGDNTTKSMELRMKFEAALNKFLKENLILTANNIKILKRRISIKKTKENSASGSLEPCFYNKSQIYSLFCYVHSPELDDFFNKISPPYRPGYLNDATHIVNTFSEFSRYQMKGFGYALKGTVNLPGNAAEREKACEWICKKIQSIYLPRVMNIIDLKPEAIKNIMTFPEQYKYPFLTIFYIMKKNNMSVNDVDMNFIFSSRKRKIVGDKIFDRELLNTWLHTSGQNP